MFAAEILVTRAGSDGVTDRPDGRRRAVRSSVDMTGRLGSYGARTLCGISDLSLFGARLNTYQRLEPHSIIVLTFPGLASRRARVVWSDDYTAGCAFDDPLDQAVLDDLVARCGFSPADPEIHIFHD